PARRYRSPRPGSSLESPGTPPMPRHRVRSELVREIPPPREAPSEPRRHPREHERDHARDADDTGPAARLPDGRTPSPGIEDVHTILPEFDIENGREGRHRPAGVRRGRFVV